MEPGERAAAYAERFPKWPKPRSDDRWIDGVWVMGNDYRNKTRLYGAYPPNYLDRVMALFPDKTRVLHLFAGSLPPGDYTRFDMMRDDLRDPDVQGDAHELSNHFDADAFDLVVADPPYSVEDAVHYGPPMVNRKKVIHEVAKVTEVGGHLVWLDQVLPMFTKREWNLMGLFGIVRSTNHRIRATSIFEREASKETA